VPRKLVVMQLARMFTLSLRLEIKEDDLKGDMKVIVIEWEHPFS
jgi:hypothetical protein